MSSETLVKPFENQYSFENRKSFENRCPLDNSLAYIIKNKTPIQNLELGFSIL